MRKFLWSSLIASCLMTSVMAEEPPLAPAIEAIEVEITDVALNEVEVIEGEVPVTEILEVEALEADALKSDNVDPQILEIDAPIVDVKTDDFLPVFFFLRGNAPGDAPGDLPLLVTPSATGDGELTLDDESPVEVLQDNVDNPEIYYSTAGGLAENNINPLQRNNHGLNDVRPLALDRANNELRPQAPGLVGHSDLVPRPSLISGFLGRREERMTADASGNRLHPAVKDTRPLREREFEQVRPALTDYQRTYARELAEVDALRDQAIKTRDANLLRQAESRAAQLRTGSR